MEWEDGYKPEEAPVFEFVGMLAPPPRISEEDRRAIERHMIGMHTARLYEANPHLVGSPLPSGWDRVWEPYLRRVRARTSQELYEALAEATKK